MKLSECEYMVAKEISKGHTPDEIADILHKSVWTIKAQIRDIHRKLSINNNVELTLYLICERLKVNFDLNEIRKHGLELFFSILFFIIQVIGDYHIDMRRNRGQGRTRTSVRVMRARRNNNELNYNTYELFG